jgi:hypothetical protein
MEDVFSAAFSAMAEAIAQAHPGREHAHWFCIFLDNLVYRPLFGGKSAKQLRALYGMPRKASLCASLPQEARQAMMRRMSFITEHVKSGKEYAQIKELVLSILPTEPLVLDMVPVSERSARQRRQRRRKQSSSAPMPGQLSLPGLGANEDE